MSTLSVATDFSPFPAGRFEADGPFSGETFRKVLAARLRGGPLTVVLDGTLGYGSSFLEEAFGGLVRLGLFTAKDLRSKLKLVSSDPSLEQEVWSYIDSARTDAG